jgi:Zn finger protein HypA/HybF involved in hydrogenase expression
MLNRNLWHKSLTNDAIIAACERRMTSLDDPGLCLICGNEAEGVEPDARNYECEACGSKQVFGVEELLLGLAI